MLVSKVTRCYPDLVLLSAVELTSSTMMLRSYISGLTFSSRKSTHRIPIHSTKYAPAPSRSSVHNGRTSMREPMESESECRLLDIAVRSVQFLRAA
jgi:hypothetical protein